MKKLSIRSDLSIGDQKIGAKMNTNGLWTISELTICGLPTDQGIEEIGEAMLELNKQIDAANKGREPTKKKPVNKTVEKPDEKPEDKTPKKLRKKNKEKTEEAPTDPPASENKNKELQISGGTDLKPDSGEKGKKVDG